MAGIPNFVPRQDEILLTLSDDSAQARAFIRPVGAYITTLNVGGLPLLTSPGRNPYRPDEPLPDTIAGEPVKMDAAHSMVPVGITKGQYVDRHGNSRYRPYQVYGEPASGEVVLDAHDDDYGLEHSKTYQLQADGLTVIDSLENTGDSEQHLSIGEHFYIPVQEADIRGITILDGSGNATSLELHQMDGEALTGSFADMDAGLQAGETFFHMLPSGGSRSFAFPDGRVVTVSAKVESSDGLSNTAGLFIWHRPGSDTLCIEPLAGAIVADSDQTPGLLTNTGIVLTPGVTVSLTSSISVRTAGTN